VRFSMFKLNDDRENNTKFKTLTLLARLHFQSHGPSAITEACKGHSLKIKVVVRCVIEPQKKNESKN
jgi:hypothetical protein